MKYLKSFVPVLFSMLLSCSNNKTPQQTPADTSSQTMTNTPERETGSSQQVDDHSSKQATVISPQQILDTNKLKSDLNDIENSILSGKPDPNRLKKAGADILSTDAAILSDSGISKMYGNSNDPGVIAAKNTLLKMRNSMGLTPAKLDSMKKSAAVLANDSVRHQ